MKRILFALSALAIGTAAASAADLPVKAPPAPLPPPCIWCGFYIGFNGGWAGTTGSNNTAAALSTTETGAAATPIFIGSNTFNQNTSGGFGGGQIGYNWVLPYGGAGGYAGPGGWLVGFEADIQGASLHRSSPALFFSEVGEPNDIASVSTDSRLNWFATLRYRFGFATGPVLFYGTTGVAFGGVRNNLLVGFTDNTDCDFASCSAATRASTNPRAGWVAGAGIEWMFAPNWSLKGEYQYITLGNFQQTAATAVVTDVLGETEGAVATRNVNLNFNTVRIGVNYHFGGYGAGGY